MKVALAENPARPGKVGSFFLKPGSDEDIVAELGSCVEVEVAVLGSPSLISPVVSVDGYCGRAQELCESRGGRPGFSVSNKPCGFCGRKSTLNRYYTAEELCESLDGRPGLPVSNKPVVSVDGKQH